MSLICTALLCELPYDHTPSKARSALARCTRRTGLPPACTSSASLSKRGSWSPSCRVEVAQQRHGLAAGGIVGIQGRVGVCGKYTIVRVQGVHTTSSLDDIIRNYNQLRTLQITERCSGKPACQEAVRTPQYNNAAIPK